MSTRITTIALLFSSLTFSGCYRDAKPSAGASHEQVIVNRADTSIERFQSGSQSPSFEHYLSHAKGVMIFPRVVKAALFFGGGGGNGVLLARDSSGNWSAPAFYGIGGGGAGLQIGYQEATIVLVFMTDSSLRSALNNGLTLGADATVAAGTVGEAGAAAKAQTGKDIYAFVDAGGVFAGVSLEGAVVNARQTLNESYYGPDATPYAIVVERRFDNPASTELRSRLAAAIEP